MIAEESLFHSQFFFKVLVKTFLLSALLVLIISAYSYFAQVFRFSPVISNIVLILTFLLIVFVWAVSLSVTQHLIEEKPIVWKEEFIAITQKFSYFILVFACYFVIALFFVGLAILLAPFFNEFITNAVAAKSLSFLLILGIPFLFFMLLFYFTIPFIVIKNLTWYVALNASARFVNDQHWIKTIVMYFLLIFIFYLVMPGTHHHHWLSRYFLNAPFSLLVISITLPIYNLLILKIIYEKLAL